MNSHALGRLLQGDIPLFHILPHGRAADTEPAGNLRFVPMDCWAPWCMPCRAQQPILEKVTDELQGKALITSLNIDENREAAYRLNIHSIPTLVIFNDGEEIRRFFGLQKADSLTKELEGALISL